MTQRDLRSRKFPLMERLERIGRRETFKEKEETFPTFNRLNSLEMFEDEPVVQEKSKPKNFTRLGLLKERKHR